jgi:prevent-host-death family protein
MYIIGTFTGRPGAINAMNVSIAKVRNSLADALNRAAYAGERVILERRGKPIAALVSMEDVELLERLETEADLKAVRKARRKGGQPIPLARARRALEVRKDHRTKRSHKG